MTYKASELIINLMLSEYGYGKDKAREELQAYIEELERKAEEYDEHMRSCEQGHGDSPYCSAHRD